MGVPWTGDELATLRFSKQDISRTEITDQLLTLLWSRSHLVRWRDGPGGQRTDQPA